MNLARLRHIDGRELAWRGRAAARIAWDRLSSSRTRPAWDRGQLLAAIADDPALEAVRDALAHERWREAHRALAFHIAFMPQRFVLASSNHSTIVSTVRDRFPGALADATLRAERIVVGRYDLLGYRDLAFRSGTVVDWHHDPVHDCARAAPVSGPTSPISIPRCGDHKIIWELNRQQHWLTLGRAFWLTGDVRYRDRCIAELTSWMAANPPLIGINWASMLELGFAPSHGCGRLPSLPTWAATDEPPWIVDLLLALDRQLSHIEQNLSYYFSPNTHLLGEALALYVCSRSLPLLRGSAGREALGRRVLLEESRRQIVIRRRPLRTIDALSPLHARFLSARDRSSPASHAIPPPRNSSARRRVWPTPRVCWPTTQASCRRLATTTAGCCFRSRAARPTTSATAWPWLPRCSIGPYLRIGAAARRSVLAARASLARSRGSSETPPATARAAAVCAPFATPATTCRGRTAVDHLVIDGGVHGYLNGGHAHADALSLTLTVAGVPLLVDPGTGAYTIDRALRDRLRSSQMHNTLVVDGRSQSIGKGPFSWTTMAQKPSAPMEDAPGVRLLRGHA